MGQASRMYAFKDKANKMMRVRRPMHPDRLIKEWQIWKGDKVEVIAGLDKGKQGVVKDVIKERNLLVVEGVRVFTRSLAPMPLYKEGKEGGLISEERALRYEEVMLVDPQLKKPTHVDWEVRYNPALGRNQKMRFSLLSGAAMPIPEKEKPKDPKDGERDTKEELVKKVTFTSDMFVHPFPTPLVNEMYRMSRKGGEGRAL